MNNHSIHMIGNAHLDPAWLWRWQEGFSEIKATFQSALDRMNEFEEFTFTASSASLYEWIEENSPTMFREIKVRVKEGRWIIAGGMFSRTVIYLEESPLYAIPSIVRVTFMKNSGSLRELDSMLIPLVIIVPSLKF